MLYERGELNRYFEGDDVPGFALYTATWGLIVPHLAEAYPGNRKMGVQVQAQNGFIKKGIIWMSQCALFGCRICSLMLQAAMPSAVTMVRLHVVKIKFCTSSAVNYEMHCARSFMHRKPFTLPPKGVLNSCAVLVLQGFPSHE